MRLSNDDDAIIDAMKPGWKDSGTTGRDLGRKERRRETFITQMYIQFFISFSLNPCDRYNSPYYYLVCGSDKRETSGG